MKRRLTRILIPLVMTAVTAGALLFTANASHAAETVACKSDGAATG